MIRDSRLCEAAHHHLGTDLRQKHQFGVWIKFFLTFNKIKVLKNIFFPLYTISTASPINITLPGTPQHLPARTAEGWKERTKVQICIVKCNFISLSIMLFLGRIKNKTMGKKYIVRVRHTLISKDYKQSPKGSFNFYKIQIPYITISFETNIDKESLL